MMIRNPVVSFENDSRVLFLWQTIIESKYFFYNFHVKNEMDGCVGHRFYEVKIW